MNNKFLIASTALFFMLIMIVYFILNPSYQKSLEAKYYFETGSYKEAYLIASEAFSIDIYNRMASTIMAQSKTSLKYVKYNNTAKSYMKKINSIANKNAISDADKAKIKIMCEIMIDSYIKLAPSVITDKDLVQETKNYYENFEKLLEKVTQ